MFSLQNSDSVLMNRIIHISTHHGNTVMSSLASEVPSGWHLNSNYWHIISHCALKMSLTRMVSIPGPNILTQSISELGPLRRWQISQNASPVSCPSPLTPCVCVMCKEDCWIALSDYCWYQLLLLFLHSSSFGSPGTGVMQQGPDPGRQTEVAGWPVAGVCSHQNTGSAPPALRCALSTQQTETFPARFPCKKI